MDTKVTEIIATIRRTFGFTISEKDSLIRAIENAKQQYDQALQGFSDAANTFDSQFDPVKQFLGSPIILRSREQTFQWDRDTLERLISINCTDTRVDISPNLYAISAAVDTLAQSIDRGSVEPRVSIKDGTATITRSHATGIRLDRTETVQRICDALMSTDRIVELPTTIIHPRHTDVSAHTLQCNDMLSVGRSSFAGSANARIANVVAGANCLNGVVIAPGETFSFNTEVLTLDTTNGFVPVDAAELHQTSREWGGGICQVVTTLFRAVFYAGLPIKERHAHPYYVKWYNKYAFPYTAGPGLDAFIVWGQQDFQFINDTGHWLAIETIVDLQKQIIEIRLHGTATGRSVRVAGPIITDTESRPYESVEVNIPTLPKDTNNLKGGMSVVVTRTVTINGQELPSETFRSDYQPWDNTVSPGTSEVTYSVADTQKHVRDMPIGALSYEQVKQVYQRTLHEYTDARKNYLQATLQVIKHGQSTDIEANERLLTTYEQALQQMIPIHTYACIRNCQHKLKRALDFSLSSLQWAKEKADDAWDMESDILLQEPIADVQRQVETLEADFLEATGIYLYETAHLYMQQWHVVHHQCMAQIMTRILTQSFDQQWQDIYTQITQTEHTLAAMNQDFQQLQDNYHRAKEQLTHAANTITNRIEQEIDNHEKPSFTDKYAAERARDEANMQLRHTNHQRTNMQHERIRALREAIQRYTNMQM